MKLKIAALFFSCLILVISGCKRNDLSYIIENYPCFKGIVTEVTEKSVVITVNEDEEERKSSDLIVVPLNAENPESIKELYVGDEVMVYYSGEIMESYPAQLNKVYAIILINGSDERTTAD